MIRKILIYNSGGGIGDSIQLFPLILSLKDIYQKSEIYYLGAHENHYVGKLKEYNIKVKDLNLRIEYFGFRWWHLFVVKRIFSKLKMDKFDLIIDCQSKLRNTAILKQIPSKAFYSSTFNYIFCSRLEKPARKFSFDLKIGKYDIKNIEKKYFDEALRLLPNKNYIGFSLTQGNIYRKKEWELSKIIKLSQEFVQNNKTPVFFIEKKYQELKGKIKNSIPTALFPEHETELGSPALVTCLGKRLDFAISIDNGIMHMLSLAKIPMVVLFGPTNSKKFAPNYNDIILLDSKELKNTPDINSINVEDVLQKLKLHSGFSY
jgi:ADP-heptose:LPS heptosyltransferase